jgi:hypothetical protein
MGRVARARGSILPSAISGLQAESDTGPWGVVAPEVSGGPVSAQRIRRSTIELSWRRFRHSSAMSV